VITDAYRHAESGRYSRELDILAKIDRFGIEAILGRRVLYYGELRRMILAENIVIHYRRRAASSNWAAYALDNPEMAQILLEAEKLCQNP
jgi:hypothetical protein